MVYGIIMLIAIILIIILKKSDTKKYDKFNESNNFINDYLPNQSEVKQERKVIKLNKSDIDFLTNNNNNIENFNITDIKGNAIDKEAADIIKKAIKNNLDGDGFNYTKKVIKDKDGNILYEEENQE